MFDKVSTLVCIYLAIKVFVWVLHSFDPPKKKRAGKFVRFAVAIPAHNEGASIRKTVLSLLEGGMPSHDIFVLCNGCNDNTAEEVSKCGVVPIVVPVRGKEETLTYAIDVLKLFFGEKYDYVCFFDADTKIDSKYFKITREVLRNDRSIDIICGRPKSLPCNWLTAHRAVQYWSFHAIHKHAQGKMSSILAVPGCAGIYSVESLRKIVWSPDTRVGDIDATIQATKKGMKIIFEPRAIVYTQDPNNLRDYTNQLFRRWNRGLWMNMRKHGILWKGFSFQKKNRLNWDCRLMFLDQAAPLIFLVVVKIFHLEYYLVKAIGIYIAFVFLETLACAHMENRWDILKYLPLFPLMRIYDTLLFLASSYTIFIRKEKSGVWKSPTRYIPEKE